MGDRVLITGGAGFIGSRLVRSLVHLGHRIWVLDNLLAQVHGPAADFPNMPGTVTWRLGSVADAGAMHAIVAESRPDRIFHLAAETGTGQSLTEIARYCDVNVMGTAHLVEAIRAAGLTRPALVLASTRAVYGEGAYRDQSGRVVVPPARLSSDMAVGRYAPVLPEGPATSPIPTPEDAAPNPASVYASSKLMQEYLLRQAAEAAGWPLAVLRFQNVYGPGQSLTNPYTGVLSVFIDRLLGGQGIEVYEDGAIVRDFVFVNDVVEALVLAGKAGLVDPAPINIGTGTPSTILDLARMLAQLAGRDSDCVRISGAFRPGDIRHAVADIEKANRLLGWAPRTSVSEGLAALVDWAKAARA